MSLPIGNRGNGMRVLPPRPPRPPGPSLWSRIMVRLFQFHTERSEKYRDHPNNREG